MLNSTTLARLQDTILSAYAYSPAEAEGYLHQLAAYEPMLAVSATSNLHVRQRVIQAGLTRMLAVPIGSLPLDGIMPLFDSLCRNGYWVEGPDYFFYVKEAFDWFWRVVRPAPAIADRLYRMEQDWLALVAPDGTIPWPEASLQRYTVTDHADTVWRPNCMVKRWMSGSYLLVITDPVMEPRGNFHVKPACGYFAFGSRDSVTERLVPTPHSPFGEYERLRTERWTWKVRCNPYAGWDPYKIPTEDSLIIDQLPPGAALPDWRLRPPRVTVTDIEEGVEFVWHKPWFNVKRTLTWDGGVVRCVDQWGGVRRSVREWRL